MNIKSIALDRGLSVAGLAYTSAIGLILGNSGIVQSRPIVKSTTSKYMKGRIERNIVQADQLMNQGKLEQAEQIYRRALNRNAKNGAALVGYGMVLGKEFKLDAAEQQFDKALALDPGNALAHAGKAIVLLSRLQSSNMNVIKNKAPILKQCENECNEALRIDPQMQEAHYALGLVYKEEKQLEQAAGQFQEAIKYDCQYSDAYAGLGLTRLYQGRYAEAADNFKAAIKHCSSNSTAHYGLGKAYLAQGQVDNAIQELNIALYQYRNSAPVHLALGDAYQAQGNNVAAIKEYNESIAIKPENTAAYLHIADIAEARGDIEHAIAQCRSGLELMPDNPELRLRIADDNLQVQKVDDAIKEYQAVLSVAPGSQRAVNGLANSYYLKAQKETTGAFVGSDDFEQAEGSIRKAISLHPDDLQLRFALARMQALSGQPVDLGTVGTPTNDAERLAFAQAALAQNDFAASSAMINQVIANAYATKQIFAVGDMALMIKDLDAADAAYHKAATFPGDAGRSRRGLANVARARQQAAEELTLATDLACKRQNASAIDKFHASIFDNPRVPAARLGLARTLEKTGKRSPAELREASTQYKAYLSLDTSVPQKERDKILKRAERLEARASKIEHR